MAWSAAIDTIIETAADIETAFWFSILNGYGLVEGDLYAYAPVQKDGWDYSLTDGNPSISTLRVRLAFEDFTYLDEFDHTNAVQLSARCRLIQVIYLGTVSALGGTISVTEGSRTVTGIGTTFLTTLQYGAIVVPATAPHQRLVVRQVINNTTFEAYEVSPVTAGPFAYGRIDDERQYIFQGILEDKQVIDASLLLECFDPLNKLNFSLTEIDEEATILGPYTDARLRWAPHFDDGGPEQYTYEIDPDFPGPGGQSWCENIFGTNRAFVPGVFVVADTSIPAGNDIEPTEYMVDVTLGLIRFHNDQAPAPPPSFYIREVSVYQEGTLELADVVEQALAYSAACPDLGPGFTLAQLSQPLTGTFTLTNGAVMVGGVATAFDTELEEGDRIALSATPDDKGIVASIASPILLTLRFPYKGATAGPAAGFKSTLKESGISLSNFRWKHCDGTVADLLRALRDNYSNARGYRVWYDPWVDEINADQVRINVPGALTLGPIGSLRTTGTMENLATAVVVKGKVGRAVNLITQAGVTITELATGLPLVGTNLWVLGTSSNPPGGGTYEGMTWSGVDPPASTYVNDTDLDTALMVYRNEVSGDPDYPLDENWYDLCHVDLGAEYDLSQISVYAPNCKNPSNYAYGISIHKSNVGMADLGAITPETYRRDLNPDELVNYDVTAAAPQQYLLFRMRPIKWPEDGGSRTMGVREIIIFGTTNICQITCVQSAICPGNVQLQAGTVTFNAGGPPYTVTGAGTAFGGAVATTAQVGDSIALNADPLNFGFIEEILSPTSARLVLPYPGVPGANGAFSRALWPSVDADPVGCTEAEGGHFIGGSALDADFIVDYYPELLAKLYHQTHRAVIDDSGIVFSEPQALDRAYLVLDELIRLYREILWRGSIDPRIRLFDTVYVPDTYREGAADQLWFLVESISRSESGTSISGREYGAGVLE